ncbi:hypothetical protein AB0J21_29005 [Streptomyces sp. NPDC049954]|uniref:hypothetical protein n=1 Tax=Streptomyces sp. NPDC049954 TaxID=3155779 RepID=UPI003445D42C
MRPRPLREHGGDIATVAKHHRQHRGYTEMFAYELAQLHRARLEAEARTQRLLREARAARRAERGAARGSEAPRRTWGRSRFTSAA